MAAYFCMIAALCVVASAKPQPPPRLLPPPVPLQNIRPGFNYFMDMRRHGVVPNVGPVRLESLEPDSEVELLPGAPQPQPPPQQVPVSPNLPGLVPGQRVFIVHMPVPGYRPGTVGGYQPVYIVAAAPQGNTGYANGYQNAILLNPSGQVVGYQGAGVGSQHSGVVASLRPVEQYQEPTIVYQPVSASQGSEGRRGVIYLSQLVGLQRRPGHHGNKHRDSDEDNSSSETKRKGDGSGSEESKDDEESKDEQKE